MKLLTYIQTHFVLLFAFLFFGTLSSVQSQDKEEVMDIINMEKNSFYEIQRKANRYFLKEDKKETKRKSKLEESKNDSTFFSKAINSEGREEDNHYRHYKRWEWFWRDRINADGSFHDITESSADYLRLQKVNGVRGNLKTYAGPTWVNINQTVGDGGYNGMGRAVAVAFHPTLSNTYFVGAPIGGTWKTSDGGTTYAPLTDALPYVSTGSIVVNHKKPAIMYISVGSSEGWWNWSLGIYKSYNSGATWSVTGLNWTFTNYRAIRKLVMSPLDTAILLAATTNGLYRTTNSGATWTQVRANSHTDVIYKPDNGVNDGNVVFTGTDAGDIYKSTDAGVTWTQIYSSTGDGVNLSVTLADPNTIAASHYNPKTVVYSRDLGATFTTSAGAINQSPDVFFVSQTNANVFYYGGVDVFKSTDAGANWTQITHWCCAGAGQTVVHADNHYVGASPLTPSIVYFGNDGGIYKYNEATGVWAERTNGLITTQYYRIANAQNNSVVMIGGTQDNGGRFRQANGVWRASNGGDAMEQAIDPSNYNIMYSTYVNGQLYRTTNAWGGYTEITPGFSSGSRQVGDWVAPYVLDPNNSATIVAGYKDVWRSTDRGTNWTQISTNLTGGQNLNQVAVTPGNSSIIYASRGTQLWKTINGGTNWTALTVPSAGTTTDPWGSGAITSIIISNTNANNIWISRSGYNATIKVYKSTDQGVTWTNISTGIPNVPVSCLAYENSSNDGLYAGTDAGVFYIDASLTSWQYFGQGLPNTAVTDLEIQYTTNKLRAGTHGRGIWETDLVALPIKLVSFAAVANADQKSVYISWTTAYEYNNDYFILERSTNGVDFSSIATIKGKGNSSVLESYSYTDVSVGAGNYYYRLTQVDFDQTKDHSQVVIVSFAKALEVNVYPVVFDETTSLLVTGPFDYVDIELIDVKGNRIFQRKTKTTEPMDIGAELASGIYIIKVTAPNGESSIQKISKK